MRAHVYVCDLISDNGFFEIADRHVCLQLFWPDDGNWYSVVINAINVKKRMATCDLALIPTVGSVHLVFGMVCGITYEVIELNDVGYNTTRGRLKSWI